MAAVDLLLRVAGDKELTHQVVLFVLFEQSRLASELNLAEQKTFVKMEPERGIFDLLIRSVNAPDAYIELKVWSSLSEDQFQRQAEHTMRSRSRAVYILLQAAEYEISEDWLRQQLGSSVVLIGVERLHRALDEILNDADTNLDALELARAYRDYLRGILKFRSSELPTEPSLWGKLEHYELYRRLQQRLTFETSIYTVHNRGGEKYILNDSERQSVLADQAIMSLDVDHGYAFFKLRLADSKDALEQRKVRDIVREALEQEFASFEVPLVRTGRVGGVHMAVEKLDLDLRRSPDMDATVALLETAREKFKRACSNLRFDGSTKKR